MVTLTSGMVKDISVTRFLIFPNASLPPVTATYLSNSSAAFFSAASSAQSCPASTSRNGQHANCQTLSSQNSCRTLSYIIVHLPNYMNLGRRRSSARLSLPSKHSCCRRRHTRVMSEPPDRSIAASQAAIVSHLSPGVYAGDSLIYKRIQDGHSWPPISVPATFRRDKPRAQSKRSFPQAPPPLHTGSTQMSNSSSTSRRRFLQNTGRFACRVGVDGRHVAPRSCGRGQHHPYRPDWLRRTR